MLYQKSELKKSFFFDVVASPITEKFSDLSSDAQEIWLSAYGTRFLSYEKDLTADLSVEAIYNKYVTRVPEFCKITTAAFGVFEDDMTMTIGSMQETDEKKLLNEIVEIMKNFTSATLAGYNLSGRTIPFVVKRMVLNGVKLPFLLQLRNKKPWEIQVLDVMKDYQGMTLEYLPLETLNFAFGIKLSENSLEDIELKVEAIMQIALKMSA